MRQKPRTCSLHTSHMWGGGHGLNWEALYDATVVMAKWVVRSALLGVLLYSFSIRTSCLLGSFELFIISLHFCFFFFFLPCSCFYAMISAFCLVCCKVETPEFLNEISEISFLLITLFFWWEVHTDCAIIINKRRNPSHFFITTYHPGRTLMEM